jgi:hypothetical protein
MDIAMEFFDRLIAQDTRSTVTNARQVVLKNCDEGELTASERDAEMDTLDTIANALCKSRQKWTATTACQIQLLLKRCEHRHSDGQPGTYAKKSCDAPTILT